MTVELSHAQLAELARLLAATAPEELDCDAFLHHMAAFAERHGGAAGAPDLLRALRQHMEVCPECKEEFEALLRAVEGDG